MSRRGVELALQGVVLLALVALVAGQLLGQPILLGFVETGSMEPTIETGDGFVAIPDALTGDPEPGDIVVFEAETIQGGGLTTHRIVDESEQGYVTHGDANPFTDQDGGEPPVQNAQIVAEAWQVNGDAVTIPSLGTAIMTMEGGLERVQGWLATTFGVRAFLGSGGLAYLVLGLSVVLYVAETIRERRTPAFESRLGRDDDEFDPRLLCVAFALLVVVAAGAAMFAPAGSQSYDVVSADFESDRPLVIEQGTTDQIPYAVLNGGYVPVISYVDSGSNHVAVTRDRVAVGPRGEDEISLSVTAPDETGHYPTYVTEYRYLHVLPVPVVDALYDVHPWVPFAVILSLLGGGTYGVGRLLLGPGDVRARRDAVRRRCSRTRSIVRRLY